MSDIDLAGLVILAQFVKMGALALLVRAYRKR